LALNRTTTRPAGASYAISSSCFPVKLVAAYAGINSATAETMCALVSVRLMRGTNAGPGPSRIATEPVSSTSVSAPF